MKTIRDYLKTYGKYTFLEKEFNEVDNVICSLLAYIDFKGIVPIIDHGSITIEDASKLYFKKYSKKEINKNILSIRDASNLLRDIASTNRYKDLELLNYEYQVSFDYQFGAICIKLPDKTMYVAYEGTDGLISGWEEDARLSYMFPVKAQELAIEYLNMVVKLFGPKVYVGGHSKGGNLALVASMYCRLKVFYKIKWVYNNDGPGLRQEIYESNRYKRISFRYSLIVPEDSFFGLILCHDDNFVVVKSNKKKLFQHNAVSWEVEGNHFAKGVQSDFSKKANVTLNNWLARLDDEKRETFFNELFSVLKKCNITDLTEIKKAKLSSIIKISKQMKNITPETKQFLTATLKDLYNEWKS